jgi:YidC/Oxa1 family membrane protein insertase
MDRKSIIVLVICFAVLFSWHWVVDRIYPPKPLPPGATNVVSGNLTNTNPNPGSLSASPTSTPPRIAEAPAPARAASFVANTNVQEELLYLTNAFARYAFTSRGGGLKQVELLRYPEAVVTRGENKSTAATNRVATLNSFTLAPTLALLDGETVQGDGVFTLTPTNNGVRAEKSLTNGLTLVKEFELSTNYLILVNVKLENRSDQPLALPAQHWFVGTATPMSVQDDGSAVGVMWFNGSKSQEAGAAFFSTSGFMCMPRVPPAEYKGGSNDVAWAAVHNQYFALAVMPHDPATEVVVRKINLPPPSEQELMYRTVRQPAGYEAALVYPGLALAPHEAKARSLAIYAGPKEYRTLATISSALNNNIDAIMGFGFWGFFSKALLLGMNWLHAALRLPYGWAIVAITIIIKVVFWPLTQASTRSAKRMQALQPQIKALQEKYKDDPAKAQRKMMEFWKENKINPMSGCLPTLIQMPVFFGFFFMIRSAIELRGASWLWVADLSNPDTLFIIPGVGFPFNLLPLVMGATMLWQSHLTPPSPGMDPTQAKMMRYMPLMFLVFLYNYSAGLTLYWTVQNLLSILQTKLIRTTMDIAAPAKAPALTPAPKKRK